MVWYFHFYFFTYRILLEMVTGTLGPELRLYQRIRSSWTDSQIFCFGRTDSWTDSHSILFWNWTDSRNERILEHTFERILEWILQTEWILQYIFEWILDLIWMDSLKCEMDGYFHHHNLAVSFFLISTFNFILANAEWIPERILKHFVLANGFLNGFSKQFCFRMDSWTDSQNNFVWHSSNERILEWILEWILEFEWILERILEWILEWILRIWMDSWTDS